MGAKCCCTTPPQGCCGRTGDVESEKASSAQDGDVYRNNAERQDGGVVKAQVPLLYVEKEMQLTSDRCSNAGSSTAPTSKLSISNSTAKTMSVLQAAGHGINAIPASLLDKTRLAEFIQRLDRAGLPLTKWGLNGAKSVEHLFWETEVQKGCIIIGGGSTPLKRITRIIKIKLVADIFGVEHALFSRLQFLHDGQTIERKQVPLKKLEWKVVVPPETASDDQKLRTENCQFTEDWMSGCKKALKDRLGLSDRWQEQNLEEDVHAYVYRTEDDVKSAGYPGLNTLYCIHEVTFRVSAPESPGVSCIGLPGGQEFATTEGDFNFSQLSDDKLAIGTQLNIWTWDRYVQKAEPAPSSPSRGKVAEKPPDEAQQRLIKRVPIPSVSAQTMCGVQGRCRSSSITMRPPSAMLRVAQEGRTTDWSAVRGMARRISDKDYSLQQFNKDLSVFPELDLYLLDGEIGPGRGSTFAMNQASSGRSIGDEYQRTIGAFFAIYWLMRMHVDGKEGFAFGVDENWRPMAPDPKGGNLDRLFPAEKRLNFYNKSQWDYFQQLLLDAELLKKTSGGGTAVNENRVMTLLALTAVHDVMKVQALLPKVQPDHAPYHGYGPHDTIGDHDHALSYVMDYFPELLPSFNGLDDAEKRSVQFTQCQLCFNQGWLVQAEAPPGALFTKFRELLIRDHRSQIQQRDIALYFVHWLTDLAGAEPTPLGGCEKFVVKFPLPVLNSFLRSFSYVQKIAVQTETEVQEEYLKMRWTEHTPSLGPVPVGPETVAKMRLICMAQLNAVPILKAFNDVPPDDRSVLAIEMARTGCMSQSFSKDIVPDEVTTAPYTGPALLVYYGPAYLQSLGSDNPVQRLRILAEVFRCARELWPASVAQVAHTVTVRIDLIKHLTTGDMLEASMKGDLWLVVRHNDNEAFVERSSKKKLNKFIATRQCVQILDMGVLMGE